MGEGWLACMWGRRCLRGARSARQSELCTRGGLGRGCGVCCVQVTKTEEWGQGWKGGGQGWKGGGEESQKRGGEKRGPEELNT